MKSMTAPLLWLLPEAAMTASISEMAPDGARGCEGVALWLGRRSAGVVTVTHVVALRGPGITKRPDHLSISADLLNEVTMLAMRDGVYVVGQIHSHPGKWVDLSEVDKRYGISIPGYLSVVAPDFARRPSTAIAECGVHVFDHGTWRRLGAFERACRVISWVGEVAVEQVGVDK
jgi:proteasome lid subunit RPN8/RPN11